MADKLVADLLRRIGPGAFGSQGEYEEFREAVDDYSPPADDAKADAK